MSISEHRQLSKDEGAPAWRLRFSLARGHGTVGRRKRRRRSSPKVSRTTAHGADRRHAPRRSRNAQGDGRRARSSERLVQIIKELQRHRFGRRAEALPEDQSLLALEDIEQTEAGAAEAEQKSPAERTAAATRRRTKRGALPTHLPRIETIVDVEDKACPCCKGELHRIGEDVSERLDIIPAQFRVWSCAAPNTRAALAKTSSSRRPRRRG